MSTSQTQSGGSEGKTAENRSGETEGTAIGDATTSRVPPPFCDPDAPRKKFDDYPKDFDMIDTEEQLQYWSLLREPLQACKSAILKVYREIDEAAKDHQWWHRCLANTAAFAGTIAVLIAIAQLAFPETFERLGARWLEFVAIVLAVIAVVLIGWRFRWLAHILLRGKSPWLLERHKAERLRFLKFRFLVDRETWSGPERYAKRVERLEAEVERLCEMDQPRFKVWAEELGEPLQPEGSGPCEIGSEALGQLVAYYRAKRVVYQQVYFADRATRNTPWARVTGWLAPALFFVSVVSVLAHFILDVSRHGAGAHEASRILVYLAAILPTIGAGVRSVRAAHEFARNKLRYHAKAFVLEHKDTDLRAERSADATLRDLDFCERVLELEHLEWARLMCEAEYIP